ncbi:MAG TPA: response regulator [Candidatus Dormibacteraeota bacterium]|nr:response regulator [Candidatus Dormibacteraeota bacterium]
MLLAEDDGATAEMYRIGLEAAGFRVRVAADVTAVFAAMETEIPDVAVLDYHLSGIITGLDILDNIRLDVRAESLPVLILTNDSGRNGERDRARRAGALGWLSKHETDPVRLAAGVSEVLDSGRGRSSSRPTAQLEARRIVGLQKGDGVKHGRPEASAS